MSSDSERSTWLAMADLKWGLSPTHQVHFAKYLLLSLLDGEEAGESAGWLEAAMEQLDRVPSNSPLS